MGSSWRAGGSCCPAGRCAPCCPRRTADTPRQWTDRRSPWCGAVACSSPASCGPRTDLLLLHDWQDSYRIPAVNEAVETDDSNLLGPAVETERPDSVCLLALLDHHGFGVVVAGVVSARHLLCNVTVVILSAPTDSHLSCRPWLSRERDCRPWSRTPGTDHPATSRDHRGYRLPRLSVPSLTWSNIQSEWAFSPTQMGSRVGRR